jgi:predicted ribosomally synthesized peptide with nif11-like leader
MDEKRMKEVFSDEEFVKHLFTLKEPEEVQDALKEKGIDFSIEQIVALKDSFAGTVDQELSEGELEGAAGGSGEVGLVSDVLKIVDYSIDGWTHFIEDCKGWKW